MDEGDVLDEAERACLALVRGWREQVNATAGEYVSARINELLIQELELLHHAVSARQIELTGHAVAAAKERLSGSPSGGRDPGGLARRVTGLGVALARRRHPITGARLVHQALVLTQELPQVLAAMRAGELGETQAAILVRETDGLTSDQRTRVAEAVRERWPLLGDRGLGEAARDAAHRIAPEEVAARHAKAVADRHVSFRSAPDAMLRLTALLPVRDGLACVQALQAAADTRCAGSDADVVAGPTNDAGEAIPGVTHAAADPTGPAAHGTGPAAHGTGPAAGDVRADSSAPSDERRPPGRVLTGTPRQKWRQAQADALVARLVGTTAEQLDEIPAVVKVNLLVPMEALTGDAGGHLDGYGAIPGHLVRDLIDACPDQDAPQIRRLFTAPGTGDLVGLETRSRTYTGLLRQFIRLRDQRCRTPYCESPIRHIDHITPVAAGGRTTAGNAGGGCERCNYNKELPGYVVTGTADDTIHTIGLVTAHSRPPAPPGPPPAVDLPVVLPARPPSSARGAPRRDAPARRARFTRHNVKQIMADLADLGELGCHHNTPCRQ